MAYLTNYTYSKLCGKLQIKDEIDLDFFLKHVYDDAELYFIFNKFELRYLFNYKALLDNEDRFYVEYYKVVPERIDNKNYVFERGGKPKYHIHPNCKFIHKDFIDFAIPEDIREVGDEAVVEFREWFKLKGYAESYFHHTLDLSKVVFDYNVKFPQKYNVKPLNEGYKLVQVLPNSNHSQDDVEFSYDEFVQRLTHLKKTFSNIFSCKITRTLSKLDYLLKKSDTEIEEVISEIFSSQFIKNFTLLKAKEKFNISKKLKFDLMQLLIEYFKWTYNLEDKAFNNVTLENFGLECCGHCKKMLSEEGSLTTI